MLAGIALLLSAQAQLPLIDLGGVKVPVVIPTWEADPVSESRLVQGMWTYHFRNGNLTGRSRSGGDWKELESLVKGESAAVVASGFKWPMKIFVAAHLDQLSQTQYGFWMPRKYVIDFDELKGVRNEVALFCHMAKAYTHGRVEIEPDFEVDQEIRLLAPDQTADDAMMDSLRGRLITSKGYRSCFAISSELSNRTTSRVIGNVPTTFVPFYASFDLSSPGQLARELFNRWTEQLQTAAELEGYEIGSPSQNVPLREAGRKLVTLHDPLDALTSKVWQDLADAKTPNFDRNRPEPNSSPKPWKSVSEEPWTSLPYLSETKLAAMGVKITAAESGVTIDSAPFDFNARGTLGAGGHLWVQDRYLDLLKDKLSDRNAVGFIAIGGRVLVAFAGAGSASDADLLGQSGTPVPPVPAGAASLPFDAGEAEKLASAGYLSMRTIVDNDRGAVGELRQYPRPRFGWVRLLGTGGDSVLFDAAKQRYLEFWLKVPIGAQPLDLVAATPSGPRRYRLLGRSPALKDHAVTPGVDLQLTPDGSWQKVSIDLKGTDASDSIPVTSLYLAAPPESSLWSPPNPVIAMLFDDLRVVDTLAGTALPTRTSVDIAPVAEAADPYSRAMWAATVGDDPAKLRAMLDDKDGLVVLNALIKFGTRQDKAAIPSLIRSAQSFIPRPSRLAYDALAAQDSDEAWTAISRSLAQGPFDINKREGARLIVQKNHEPKMAGQISLLFVSPSWETRRQAAIALSKVDGEPAKVVSLSFVNGTEAAIREAAITVADASVAMVCDRLLAMLDPLSEPSDYLRALAMLKLIGSEKEKYVTPAWKHAPNLAPPALGVFLEKLPAKADYRPQVIALATAGDATSVSAVLGWLGRAGGVKTTDLAAINVPADPRVYLTLLELRKKGQAEISSEIEQQMRQSRDFRVREQLGNE